MTDIKNMEAYLILNGYDPAEVYAYADKMVCDRGGVGRYITFVHLDCRGYKSRWVG